MSDDSQPGPWRKLLASQRKASVAVRLAALFWCVFFAAYGYFAQDIQLDFWAEQETFNARTFPNAIAIGGFIVSLLLLAIPGKRLPAPSESLNWMPALLIVVAMLSYAALLELLGFVVTSFLFLAIATALLGERRWRYLLLGSVPLVLGVAALMAALDIHLAPGEVWLRITAALP